MRNGRVIYTTVPEQKKTINPAYNYVIWICSGMTPASLRSPSLRNSKSWGRQVLPTIIKMVVGLWVHPRNCNIYVGSGDQEFIRFNTLADGQEQ
ncbi:MAG: hypothetical protein IPP49_12150 [Saprospiraceae bacterium]|nr:hypothetical protein [Saprospiraceae bacterium]